MSDAGIKAQRGKVTCPKSHSLWMTHPALQPSRVTFPRHCTVLQPSSSQMENVIVACDN